MILLRSQHKTGVTLLNCLKKALESCGFSAGSQVMHLNKPGQKPPKSSKLRGIHLYRHPLEVLASSYKYHLRDTKEPWLRRKVKALDGMSYQEYLNSLPMEEGITFEATNRVELHSALKTVEEMVKENTFPDDRFMSIGLERFYLDYDATLETVIEHLYPLLGAKKDEFRRKASKCSLQRRGREYLEKHVTRETDNLYEFPDILSLRHESDLKGSLGQDPVSFLGYDKGDLKCERWTHQ